jgi:protein SCO1/2
MLLLMSGTTMPAHAHSLQFIEDDLRKNEKYVQLINQPAPTFTLEDADEKQVSLDDFKGKVVVLNFVYARCKDDCPLHSRYIASIQTQINQTPMREQMQFVSVATDTEDAGVTVAAMRGYAAIYGLDPTNWTFLYRGSGASDTTIMLAKQYGLEFVPTAEGEQMHGVVTNLIDQSGRLRARYHGLSFKPVNLITHAGALLHGAHDEVKMSAQPDPDAGAMSVWIWGAVALLSLGVLIFGGISLYRTLKTE